MQIKDTSTSIMFKQQKRIYIGFVQLYKCTVNIKMNLIISTEIYLLLYC